MSVYVITVTPKKAKGVSATYHVDATTYDSAMDIARNRFMVSEHRTADVFWNDLIVKLETKWEQ